MFVDKKMGSINLVTKVPAPHSFRRKRIIGLFLVVDVMMLGTSDWEMDKVDGMGDDGTSSTWIHRRDLT